VREIANEDSRRGLKPEWPSRYGRRGAPVRTSTVCTAAHYYQLHAESSQSRTNATGFAHNLGIASSRVIPGRRIRRGVGAPSVRALLSAPARVRQRQRRRPGSGAGAAHGLLRLAPGCRRQRTATPREPASLAARRVPPPHASAAARAPAAGDGAAQGLRRLVP
jgi:hypothetical protein